MVVRVEDECRGKRGPVGIGFQLTSDADYDVQGKRLCNIGKPIDSTDAVNYEILLKTIQELRNQISENKLKFINTTEELNTNAVKNRLLFQRNSEAIQAMISTYHNEYKSSVSNITDELIRRMYDTEVEIRELSGKTNRLVQDLKPLKYSTDK